MNPNRKLTLDEAREIVRNNARTIGVEIAFKSGYLTAEQAGKLFVDAMMMFGETLTFTLQEYHNEQDTIRAHEAGEAADKAADADSNAAAVAKAMLERASAHTH